MRQIFTLVLLLVTVGVCFAQIHPVPPPYYDTFADKFINPHKWLATPLRPWGTPLELVREIRNGQLRLAVRNVGGTDSNSGWQYSQTELNLPDAANKVTGMSAELTVSSANGIQCVANPDEVSHAQVHVGGTFFNTGSGDPADDKSGLIIIWVDTPNPKVVNVGAWSEDVGWFNIGQYKIGERLTATIQWDHANHRFIGSVTNQAGTKQVVVPYTTPDTTPPAVQSKGLYANVTSPNCLGTRTFARVEAYFDNVIITH
jgi:hypothetical protein